MKINAVRIAVKAGECVTAADGKVEWPEKDIELFGIKSDDAMSDESRIALHSMLEEALDALEARLRGGKP